MRCLSRPFTVDVHMMKQLDMIHYQNNEHCGITMIGTEVHTEYGFSPRRLLYVVKMYSLPADDAKTLFSMRRHAMELKVPSIRIIIISSSFVCTVCSPHAQNKGTEYPVTEECLTDIQATRFSLPSTLIPRVIQYLSVYGCITPDLDRIKEVMDESMSSRSESRAAPFSRSVAASPPSSAASTRVSRPLRS